ncbi:HIT domain-containing protein [candidate division KSB1 bacterium]|nr:HIT domain-containing protein [candidate division KSB1 bacterium]
MDKLWAPWRMEYILSEKPKECIFCKKPKQNRDRENLILFRGKLCFVIMNYFPYNNGHLMVVPYRHTSELPDLNAQERTELFDVIAHSVSVLQVIKPHGMNIGMNLGRTAGAGIDDHLHFHIVPRWDGDTNFMPVTGHTKVISQGLYESWEMLKPHF